MRHCFHIEGSTDLADRRAHAKRIATGNPITKQETVILHKHAFGLSCSFNKNLAEDTDHEIFISDNEGLPRAY